MNQSLKTSQIPHSVEAPLTFAIRDGAVLVSLPSRPGGGAGRYEGEHETRIVEITNAWPLADELNLDREGFQLVHHHTDVDFPTMANARRLMSARPKPSSGKPPVQNG